MQYLFPLSISLWRKMNPYKLNIPNRIFLTYNIINTKFKDISTKVVDDLSSTTVYQEKSLHLINGEKIK